MQSFNEKTQLQIMHTIEQKILIIQIEIAQIEITQKKRRKK